MDSGFDDRRRRILVVDDEFVNRQMLGFILNTEFDVIYADNGIEAIAYLQNNHYAVSLIMLDLVMPEMDGFEFLRIRQKDEKLREIPVIVLTTEKEAELRSLREGATDFIKKPYDMPEVILARAHRIVELSEGRQVIRGTERDKLTGLYTKSYFYQYVTQRERFYPNRIMDVCALNIERFYLVNEVFGRDFGDRVLIEVADILRDFLKSSEGIACRGESDWFFVYFSHQENFEELVHRFQEELYRRIPETSIRIRVGLNTNQDKEIEIARRCDQARIAADTLRNDYTRSVALYDVKLHEDSLLAYRLINEVQQAIYEKQLVVHYQPKFGIQGGKPVLKSAEALVRWTHPELGMISPGVFIPLFEKNGLIQKVDYYVWREAGAQIKAWRDKYGITFPISVNVSRIDMYDPYIEAKLMGILREFELEPADLLLEVTESAYVENATYVVDVVKQLKDLGFQMEMDDFGSGYSSLNMITSLPIDVLKIDMKLIRNIHKDEKSLHLVEAILDIARFMSLSTVAEGVETTEQFELLKKAGCDIIQGWYFSKPVPAREFEKFIEDLLIECKDNKEKGE